MSLSQAVATYVGAYQGHTQYEGIALAKLLKALSDATIDQIINENNALTEQRLWTNPLMDMVYNELRDRMFSDTTYAVSVSDKGEIGVWVGFEDSYPPFSFPSNPIIVGGSELQAEPPNKEVVDLLLLSNGIYAFVDEDQVKFRRTPTHYTVPVMVQPSPYWDSIHQVYQGVRKSTPVIVDLAGEDLIGQLIDYQQAMGILSDGGYSIEGDLFLAAAESDED